MGASFKNSYTSLFIIILLLQH